MEPGTETETEISTLHEIEPKTETEKEPSTETETDKESRDGAWHGDGVQDGARDEVRHGAYYRNRGRARHGT